jgi:hypothetical protein
MENNNFWQGGIITLLEAIYEYINYNNESQEKEVGSRLET